MILAKDLRIGNKFLGIAGRQTVLSITDNTNRGTLDYVDENHRLAYSHLIECVENRNQYKPCEIEGIPLSIPILEELGFTNRVLPTDFYVYSSKRNCGVKVFDDNGMDGYAIWQYTDKWSLVKTIRYVHDLQNMVFYLTGEELKTK